MKLLRILLLPLLFVLLVTENQALGKYYNSNLRASSIGKCSEKTDAKVANLTKQGNPKQLGPIGDPVGRSILYKPKGWIMQASKNKNGTKIVNPNDPHDYIRFSPKNIDSRAPIGQQYPYFQRYKHGKALTQDGKWVSPKTHLNKQDFHIPQEKFEELRPLLELD